MTFSIKTLEYYQPVSNPRVIEVAQAWTIEELKRVRAKLEDN